MPDEFLVGDSGFIVGGPGGVSEFRVGEAAIDCDCNCDRRPPGTIPGCPSDQINGAGYCATSVLVATTLVLHRVRIHPLVPIDEKYDFSGTYPMAKGGTTGDPFWISETITVVADSGSGREIQTRFRLDCNAPFLRPAPYWRITAFRFLPAGLWAIWGGADIDRFLGPAAYVDGNCPHLGSFPEWECRGQGIGVNDVITAICGEVVTS